MHMGCQLQGGGTGQRWLPARLCGGRSACPNLLLDTEHTCPSHKPGGISEDRACRWEASPVQSCTGVLLRQDYRLICECRTQQTCRW